MKTAILGLFFASSIMFLGASCSDDASVATDVLPHNAVTSPTKEVVQQGSSQQVSDVTPTVSAQSYEDSNASFSVPSYVHVETVDGGWMVRMNSEPSSETPGAGHVEFSHRALFEIHFVPTKITSISSLLPYPPGYVKGEEQVLTLGTISCKRAYLVEGDADRVEYNCLVGHHLVTYDDNLVGGPHDGVLRDIITSFSVK